MRKTKITFDKERKNKKYDNLSIEEFEVISRWIINLQTIRNNEEAEEYSGFSGWQENNIKELTRQINRLIEIVTEKDKK